MTERERSREGAVRRPSPPRDPLQIPGHPDERVAAAVGNHAFAELVARHGAGVLPDGRAHPEVQAAIARARGGGGSLDESVRARFAPKLGDELADVRVHTDNSADALSRAVSARAFATGRDVFFARGEYRPSSSDGDRLLAHELVHVVQQRDAPAGDALRVSQPSDPLEREADRTADDLLG